MNNILNAAKNAVKKFYGSLKQNAMLRTVLISALALVLIISVTVAWYINNLGMWGVEFNTGNIDFNAYVYDASGTRLVGPVESNEENKSKYLNAPLITIENGQVGTTGTAYIMVESTGSLGIKYRIAFDIAGRTEQSTAYLGGYKYNISKVTDKVTVSDNGNLDVTGSPSPEKIDNELITIDRNSVNGTIEDKNGYDIYRIDYTLAEKNEEYTGGGINIYFNIFATQIDGDFENDDERGYTYYCSTKEDIDRAKIEAYPGDTIKLSSNIVYYGDLVFNKPVNLETNDFALTVNGNLMYDYVLGNSLKINAGGLGRIVVQCTNEGVGGNFKVKAPISDVTLVGSNAAIGDIVVEKNFTVDATNAFGSSGVSFNEIKIVDLKNTRKTIQLESNTRATVSFGTTIGAIQSVVKANNIEIVNNGEIGTIDLSNMSLLDQTNSPQIYVLNNNDIDNPIMLPTWSVKFVVDSEGKCTGNTKIIQSYTGSTTEVVGNCDFDNADVEVERKEMLVEQIAEGDDSRLKIYYQDVNGQITTIRSILENYLNNEATTGCKVNEVQQLEIISIGDKAITVDDISFMNSDSMLSLRQLDMQRANIYDRSSDTYHKLPARAFSNVKKYENLTLPQKLIAIGDYAFASSSIDNIVTVPSGVIEFGSNWFYGGKYVRFAASVPVAEAENGLLYSKAIFVDETYIDSYKSVYSRFANQIYPVSVLDETKTHFVRNTAYDEWEITYYISGEESVIGENITIDGAFLRITSVYDNAYRHNFIGTSVKFADTVENLGAGNFYNNQGITSVDLNKLKHIGNDAFWGCAVLKNITFGDELETIGANAFYNCIGLNQEVVLPDTMQTIGASAFYKTRITSVNTGGATFIDGYALYGCSDLIYAELPNVEVVGSNLFEHCGVLVSVKIPQLKKVDGFMLFANCDSLREIYMATNDNDIDLGIYVFDRADTSKLKLFVPEEYIEFYRSKRPGGISATAIYPQGEKMGEELVNGFNIGTYIVGDNGDGTYTLITSNIEHVDSLIIPEEYEGKAITCIYDNAFRNQSFTDVTLVLGNNITSIGSGAFYQRDGLIGVEFGDSLEEIKDSAFAYCTNLAQDVVLPDTIETIGASAFYKTRITSVNTGGATFIDSSAFAYCAELIYAEMPDVENVGEKLFEHCSLLVSVEMPKLITASGIRLFGYCESLREIHMASNDEDINLGTLVYDHFDTSQLKLFVPEEYIDFYRSKRPGGINAHQIYPQGEKIGSKTVNGFVVGDYVVIDNRDGYTLVTSNLDYDGNVTLIDAYNGKPITEIYANAFRNQKFTDAYLTLGGNLKAIGDNAFYGATGLKFVAMDNVTAVNAGAFYGSGLQTLNAPRLSYIGNDAFRKCADLESVSIPRIETIASTNVFAECTNLKSVYFEDVKTLNNSTFNADVALEKITINRLINSNGDNMPSTMSINASAPCKIYVPYRSLSAYPAVWSGKPVVSFDVSATNDGNTYILSDNNGRYTLIDFIPDQAITELRIPSIVSTSFGDVSIYTIGYDAFSAVSETLTTLTLSSSVALLDNTALGECTALQNIYVDANNMYFTSVNGVLYSKDAKMLVKYPIGRSGQFDMTGNDYAYTVGIAAGAFANANKLTYIVFPESLMVIDGTAFANCTQLKTVEFTGATPPVLMGSGIFDTSVTGFAMVIPTDSADLVTAYLCAYNFGEYEPYINLNGHAAPSADTPRNQVPIGNPITRNNTYAMLNNSELAEKKNDENDDSSEDDTTEE